jgi:hypothetical protein
MIRPTTGDRDHMKTTILRRISFGMIMLFCTFLFPQRGFPQTPDSLFRTSGESLQFQLLGGLGIYYIGNWGTASHFRVGFDVSFSHTDNSGDGNIYSINYSTPGSTSSSSSTNQPEQNSTSCNISLSGVYVQKVAGFANALLYGGAGPMASYSYSRNSSATGSTSTDTYSTTFNTSANSTTTRTWGIGPLAILGVRNRILDHVSLSAEVSISALYQWTSGTALYHSLSSYSPTSSSGYEQGSNSNLKGWDVSLSSIRIGVIVEL